MWEIILLALAIIFVLVVLSGFFIPAKISFSRTLSIDTDAKIIFPYINDLRNWKSWSAWSVENDPPITFTFAGKEKGAGATMQWKGRKMGAGKMEIMESIPNRSVTLEMRFNNSGFLLHSTFQIDAASATTHVIWTMQGKIKRFGIAKIIGLLLPSWIGKDMQTGLKILKLVCEQQTI